MRHCQRERRTLLNLREGDRMTYSYLDGVRSSATLEAPPRSQSVLRWMIGVLLIGHGLIHAMGPIEIWGIADVQGLSGNTTLAVSNIAVQALALAWLGAMILLVVAGIGALAGRSWWKRVALAGVILSQLLIAVWWSDAATGTIPNIIIAMAVMMANRFSTSSDTGYV
jgi:hypothetical protein